MKTKLFIVLMLTVFLAGSSFAQQTNAPEGSNNFYKNLYGTTQGASRGAMDAVVYVDASINPDFVVAGLLNLGFTVNVATSHADFNTKLLSGAYGLAVGFNQGGGNGFSASAIQSFIANGGCIIYTDWTLDNTIPNVLEANFTGAKNLSPMTITNPLMSAGVTTPMPMINPGYTMTWTMSLNAIGGGQVLATYPDGSAAAVLGNGGKSVILGYLSDVPPVADRQKLFENVVNATVCGTPAPSPIPISNWAIFIGLFLIVTFAVIRFRKMI